MLDFLMRLLIIAAKGQIFIALSSIKVLLTSGSSSKYHHLPTVGKNGNVKSLTTLIQHLEMELESFDIYHQKEQLKKNVLLVKLDNFFCSELFS